MSELRIGTVDYGDHVDDAVIDLDKYTEQGLRVGIFAASGSGKGWLLGVLLEEFIAAGMPVVAIDPESELWTFQEVGALVLGGPHGDVPLPRTDDGVRKAIEFGIAFNTPIIFDLGGIRGSANLLREGERISGIFWDIADTARRRIVFAVTEAEVFAPQTVPKTGDAPEMLATMNKRGRKRGVTMLLETQRPADIANSVITQCNVRLIGRMDDTADYDRIKRYVAPMTFGQMHRLQTGHFMLEGDEIAVRMRRVTHGGGTPIGGEITITQRPSPEGLADIIAGLREPEPVAVDLPDTKAGNRSVAGLVARGDLDRAEERAGEAERLLRVSQAAAEALRGENGRQRDRIAEAERGLRILEDFRAALIPIMGENMTAQINMPDGTTFHGNQGLGEEDIIALIRRHAPAGGPSAAATLPVDALRTRYLEAAAQRLVATVEALDAAEREVLLFLIGRPIFHTINAVQTALSGNRSSSGRQKYEKALLGLVQAGLVKVGGSGRSSRIQDVDGWVERGLAGHSATPEELEQVKNRALSVVMAR